MGSFAERLKLMDFESKDKIENLIRKGTRILNPQSVLIGEEVPIEQISGDGVVIYPGCRIFGEKTLIMAGTKLGYESPVTLEDCQLGPNVELKGGVFQRCVFLEKANMGSGALIREACILEEEAKGAHSVGLKHTILFPFVTLGSLINFCDCLMAGGTSRKNHSEVGSSYIHFNYTVNQDKATPSLIGDVPRGVMLNQPPIFLGGQGGMVGPLRIDFGTVVAAGVVCRKDVLERSRLVLAESSTRQGMEDAHNGWNFHPGVYWYVKARAINNVNYIANLVALKRWYLEVRSLFLRGDPMSKMLYAGAVEKLKWAIQERIKRLEGLTEKMPESMQKYRALMKEKANERLLKQKQELSERWQQIEAVFARGLDDPGDASVREPFLERLSRGIKEEGPAYVRVIQGLEENWSFKGTAWLRGIVDRIHREVLDVLPSYK